MRPIALFPRNSSISLPARSRAPAEIIVVVVTVRASSRSAARCKIGHAGHSVAAASASSSSSLRRPVAVLLDELAGFGELGPVAEEAGAVEVDVGEVERHGAALGDLLGLVEGRTGRRGVATDEVIERGGDEASGKIVQQSRVAQAVDGGGDVRQLERRLRQRVGENRLNQPDAGQRQVIEGDGEEGQFTVDRPIQRGCRTMVDLYRKL